MFPLERVRCMFCDMLTYSALEHIVDDELSVMVCDLCEAWCSRYKRLFTNRKVGSR